MHGISNFQPRELMINAHSLHSARAMDFKFQGVIENNLRKCMHMILSVKSRKLALRYQARYLAPSLMHARDFHVIFHCTMSR